NQLVARPNSTNRRVERVGVLAIPPHLLRMDPAPRRPAGKDDPVQTIQLGDRRVVGHNLRLDAEVLQDPPLAVGPLPSVVDYGDSHIIPKWRPWKKISPVVGTPPPTLFAYSHSIVAGGLFERS